MTVDPKYGGRTAAEVVEAVEAGSLPLPFSISVEGREGTGKTLFALKTCPLPLIHVNFGDRDPTPLLYGLSQERQERITLYNFNASGPDGWTRAECRESLNALAGIAKERLADGAHRGGTFCLDSGSSWWQALQEAYVAPEQEKREAAGGKKTGGLEYSQANLIVNGTLNWIKAQGVFLIITHQMRQDWDAKGPVPGKFSPQINRKVPYIVEVQLRLRKICTTCKSEDCDSVTGHPGRKHVGQLVKFAGNTALEGTVLESPTFGLLYALYMGKKFPNEEALV